MVANIAIHSFDHPEDGPVKVTDVKVHYNLVNKTGWKKVYFKISWDNGRSQSEQFVSEVPGDRYEFCLLIHGRVRVAEAKPGLIPARNGEPILIMRTFWSEPMEKTN
jgi:hypothetical protein